MSGLPDAHTATILLRRLADGDAEAVDQLFPLVYQELHGLAGQYMGQQRSSHTLQPTALVHEAYMKLVEVDGSRVKDRVHFFRLAAKAMRSVLVDHARGRQRAKRGGDRVRVTLDAERLSLVDDSHAPDLLDLDESLGRLEQMDEQLARIVEYRFFAGLSVAETAELLDVSTRTVERGWRVARAWLLADLDEAGDGPGEADGARPGPA